MKLKWKYYILLFGVMLFLTETISVPYAAVASAGNNNCKKIIANNEEVNTSCCAHKTKKPAKPVNPASCMDCPLYYITVLTPFFSKDFSLPDIAKKKYGVFIHSVLSSYHNKTWKPPDAPPLFIG